MTLGRTPSKPTQSSTATGEQATSTPHSSTQNLPQTPDSSFRDTVVRRLLEESREHSVLEVNNQNENMEQPGEVVNNPTINTSIKYALEAIPKFNGRDMPVTYFIEGCEEAKEMIPANQEKQFTRLVRNKLKGEARRAMHGVKFETLDELAGFFKRLYAPDKTLYQLQGEMGRIYQTESEGAISFTNRAKDLACRIKEAYKALNNGAEMTEDMATKFDKEFTECLFRGIKPEIEQKLTKNKSFNDTITEAIVIERELEAKEHLRGIRPKNTTIYRNNNIRIVTSEPKRFQQCQKCGRMGHEAAECRFRFLQPNKPILDSGPVTTLQPQNNQSNIQPSNLQQTNKPDPKVCNYCKKPGHWIAECRKRAYNNSLKEKPNAPQQPPVGPSTQRQGPSQSGRPSGNYQRPLRTSAPRETGHPMRKVMHVKTTGATEVPEWPPLN